MATAALAADPDQDLLLEALRAAGLDARALNWDASDPFDDDLVVVRSTWDYTTRRDEFLAWARAVARLANPFEAIEYSSDKSYLGDLARRGVPVVPTTFLDPGDEVVLPDGDLVVKPRVGAGSIDAARYGPGDRDAAAAHARRLLVAGRPVVLQPYVTSIDDVGERALVYVDGAFSHAMTKAAMLNADEARRTALYRWEQMSLAEAEPDALALADEVLARWPGLLYARVDLVRHQGAWVLMELELVEPSLFLTHHPPAAAALAEAVARRVG